MSEESENLDSWMNLTKWEQQCIDEVEKTQDLEIELKNAKDLSEQKLWLMFQNAATSIAQLYKDRQTGVSLWVPFQTAASSVTCLYKECIESHKPVYDLGYQNGYQKRNRDLVSWLQKKKRNIRREELIAYITGRTPPPARNCSPRPRLLLDGVRTSSHLAHGHRFAAPDPSGLLAPRAEDFDMFREALAFSANLFQHASSSPNSMSRLHRARHCNSTSTSHNELSAFISEEFSRHARKRSPTNDVIMESPTHKRSRLM